MRAIVFDVIGIPGATGDVSESADVPVALAEYAFPATHGISKCPSGEGPTVPSPWTIGKSQRISEPFCERAAVTTEPGLRPEPLVLTHSPSYGWLSHAVT